MQYMAPKDIATVSCCAKGMFEGQVYNLSHVIQSPSNKLWRQCTPVNFLKILESNDVQVRQAIVADIDAKGLLEASKQEWAWKRLRKFDFQLLFPPPFTSQRDPAGQVC